MACAFHAFHRMVLQRVRAVPLSGAPMTAIAGAGAGSRHRITSRGIEKNHRHVQHRRVVERTNALLARFGKQRICSRFVEESCQTALGWADSYIGPAGNGCSNHCVPRP